MMEMRIWTGHKRRWSEAINCTARYLLLKDAFLQNRSTSSRGIFALIVVIIILTAVFFLALQINLLLPAPCACIMTFHPIVLRSMWCRNMTAVSR